jgi:soluble lytic murein transglycosylase-like protein
MPGPHPHPPHTNPRFSLYRDTVLDVTKTYDYPPDLLAAQCAAESDWNPLAVSPVGARGLMQFMPATWAEWGLGKDPFDPRASLDAGCRYMVWLMEKFFAWDNQTEAALAAYNFGIGNLRHARNRASDEKSPTPTAWMTLQRYVPAETRDYVKKIMSSRTIYIDLLGGY